MSDFTDGSCGCGGTDPHKRVHYSHGMVLGQDDLVQEQAYLRARDHAAVRALHGYGTVSGLVVTWDGAGRTLQVSPGLAVDPVGRLVCVPAAQCADLGAWLLAHREDVAAAASGGAVAVYVVLCHRECATDTVPVPAESCLTAEESMAPSRIQDSFELRLVLDPPEPVGEGADGALTAAVDRLLALLESLPADSVLDTDPIRRELLAWATTDRPELDRSPCLDAPADRCAGGARSTAVLLARVDLELDAEAGTVTLAGAPAVDDDERPVLLSTRFLQEWLTELTLHPELLGPPPITDHNALDNLTVGDVHTQYLPADGHRPLTGDLDAGGFRLTRLAASADPADAVRHDEVFGGDLLRRAAGARLERIQGTPVQATASHAPQPGQVLTFDGAERAWIPAPVPDVGSDEPGPVLPLVTIEPVGRVVERRMSVFWLWFHPDAPKSRVALPSPDGDDLRSGEHLLVFAELCRDDAAPVLEMIDPELVRVTRLTCSTFRVDIARVEEPLLRFVVLTGSLEVVVEGASTTLFEHARRERISWLGQDRKDTVTTFVTNPPLEEPLPGFEDVDVRPFAPGGERFLLGSAR
jgi:hypothetical protein